MDIEIRKYKDSDLERVNEILEESFQITKSQIVGDDFFEIVAIEDNTVVGYLLLTRVLNPIRNIYYYNVDYVCVDSRYRGHEIGKKMLDYAYTLAKKNGVIYLQLTCSRFREAAHKLYEKCGYVKRDSDIYRKDIL